MSAEVSLAERYFELENRGNDVFIAHCLSARAAAGMAVFGGLIMAQSLEAATRTVNGEFDPNELHAQFISAASSAFPIEYRVNRVRDGRAFLNRTVVAVQRGKVVLICQLSFHKPERGCCWHSPPFPDVRGPHQSVPMNEFALAVLKEVESNSMWISASARRVVESEARLETTNDTFEIRCPTPAAHIALAEPENHTMHYWIRLRQPTTEGKREKLRFCMLTMLSDTTILGAISRAHLFDGFEMSLQCSLSHTIHFHCDSPKVSSGEWVLYECHSPFAGGGRGLADGRIFASDGRLLASVRQEGLVRGTMPSKI